MNAWRTHLLGDQALLLDCSAGADARLLARSLDQHAGIIDLIPAPGTLTIIYDPAVLEPDAILLLLDQAHSQPPPAPALHRIPVLYDGADLAEVAARCALSPARLIELHTSTRHTVAMIGFLPGFPYLDGLPARLHLPRRPTPRTKVPAGSVAIANGQTGIYPQASPGGWHLLGRTDVRLFDPARQPPALLQPGDYVEFEAVG
ncbi:MAG TPA: 5-oxoprolinase subunit PxpB [Herpetosiphonaceae bacterium]